MKLEKWPKSSYSAGCHKSRCPLWKQGYVTFRGSMGKLFSFLASRRCLNSFDNNFIPFSKWVLEHLDNSTSYILILCLSSSPPFSSFLFLLISLKKCVFAFLYEDPVITLNSPWQSNQSSLVKGFKGLNLITSAKSLLSPKVSYL